MRNVQIFCDVCARDLAGQARDTILCFHVSMPYDVQGVGAEFHICLACQKDSLPGLNWDVGNAPDVCGQLAMAVRAAIDQNKP